MNIGRLQVQVVVMSVAMVIFVVMVVFKKQRADNIHGQTHAGHNNGFVEMNGERIEQPVDGLESH